GLRFDANSGGEKKNKLGSKVTVKGTGAKADSEYDSSNIKTSITQGADGNSEINIGLAKDLNNINTIKNGGPATFTIGGNEFKFDGGNVNMGGNNITNLKSGIVNNNSTDDTNGANIGDVKTISKANDLHIAPTTSNRTGETTTSYAYDTASKSVTLKYNDGNGATQTGTIAKIDLSGLADQIKDGYSFSTDAKGNVVGNHAVTAVGNGKTVSYAAGDNLTIAQHIDNATGEQTYTYALSNDIKVGNDGKDGKPGVDGKIGVNGKDGSAVVINGKDGSIGLNGKDGKDGLTIKGANGQDGVDGKNGKDGMTRIVYEDKNNNKHEVATTDDGMKYAGDDAQGADKSKVIAKKLNETMDVVGGADKSKLTDNNIGVNNVDGKLKVQLSKEVNLTPSGSLTIGDTVVNNNGLTISGGPSITKTGINAGNKTIVNVDAGVNDTDAVNVQQLKKAKTEVKAGNNVTVDTTYGTDGHTIYTVNANDVALGDAVLKYSANGTNTQSVKLSQGLNFVDGNYTSASVDANGQVKYDVNIGNIKQGTDGKPGVDGKDGIATVKTVVDTINNSGWKANATGNVVGTSTATIVKPGSTVNYGAGKNLNVKQTVNGDEQTYEFALDKDLKELNSVQTNTIHLGSPTSHTTINYNAGNNRIEYTTKNGTKQVANLDDIWTIQANGTDVKPVGGKVNVVGGDHIKVSTDAAGKMTISADGVGTMNGFNVKSTGNTTNDSDKTAKNITDGKTVEFSGGKNLTVKQTNTTDGAKVEFALNNNIDLTPNGSVTIGDTVVNNDGLTITGGPTITKNNVDMGGQQIHNVKSGGDVDSNGANIGDIKRSSKANDTRIKDGNYEVSQNGTVEMTYVDGSGKQLV
ncbi:MAG: Tat pathway signal protein, partial [Veillonella sp.]|nr:Tat pathway signal protein [Veillonella sp.]